VDARALTMELFASSHLSIHLPIVQELPQHYAYQPIALSAKDFVLGTINGGINKTAAAIIAAYWRIELPFTAANTERWEKEIFEILHVARKLAKESEELAIKSELYHNNVPARLYYLDLATADQIDKISVIIDAAWNVRGRNSPCGFVGCMGYETRQIMDHQIYINRGSYKNCHLKAKSFEGSGVRKIMKRFMEQHITVEEYLHDGDASSSAEVQKIFNSNSEQLCINHAAKNFAKIHKKLKGPFTKVQYYNAFWHACRRASRHKNPVHQFKIELERFLNHFSGRHGNCVHPPYPEKHRIDSKRCVFFFDFLWFFFIYIIYLFL